MSEERYVVISTDAHCGADIQGYKPYLEKKYHDDFDAWAATYTDGWAAYGTVHGEEGDHKIGIASYDDDLNWDSAKRQKALEADGIVGEVLFPNTAPPFYPSGAITAAAPSDPPTDRQEYEMRFAGIRAHNRWVADFARELPGRRAAVAQVFLSDLEDTVGEIERAYNDGCRGVLLPPDHFSQLQNLYYPRYDRVWSLCADLGIPVVRHGVLPCEFPTPETGVAAAVVGVAESTYFSQRGLISMLLSGVFERHPSLKFVMTELGCAWVTETLAYLDGFFADAHTRGSVSSLFAGEAFSKMSKRPSEYFASNCYFGTFFMDSDIAARQAVGVDNMMWGADYPHFEGTVPYSVEAMRRNFSDVPVDETRRMLGQTAAEVYGFDLDVLRPLADQIGPTVEEVLKPLTPQEAPRFGEDSVCPSFGGFYLGDSKEAIEAEAAK